MTEICPHCKKRSVTYCFTSDKHECSECNYTDLFEPNEEDDEE